MRNIGVLLIANRALHGLEIEWRITVRSFPIAQMGIDARARFFFFFFQSPDIVLVPISHHFLCNCRLTLHQVVFANFLHEVNWVGAFWSNL